MHIIRTTCSVIFLIHTAAYAALSLPPPPKPLAFSPDETTFNVNAPLPNFKAPYLDTADASQFAVAHVAQIGHAFTPKQAKQFIANCQANDIPAFFSIQHNQTARVYIGPELSQSKLQNFMSRVHIGPDNSKLTTFNVFSMDNIK